MASLLWSKLLKFLSLAGRISLMRLLCSIIAVHGLSGHAYNTWVYLFGTTRDSYEVMWLKDKLPSILESRGIFPRIMIYGYRSNMFVNTNAAKIEEPALNLWNCLNAAREVIQ